MSGLVTLAVLIRGLGPGDYGRFAAVQALAATMATLSSSWVVLLLLQNALQARADLRQAFGRSLGLAIPAGCLALFIGWLLQPLILPAVPRATLVAFLAAELLGGVLVQVSAAAVQVSRGMPAAVRVRMLLTGTRLSVILGLAFAGRANLNDVAVGLLVAYGTLGLLVHFTTTRRLGLGFFPLRPRLQDIRDGLPHAGVLASLAIQEDSDKIILLRFTDPVTTGLYAAAYRLVQLGGTPLRALLGSSHPRFLINTPGERKEHLRRTIRYTVPASAYGLFAGVATIVIAPFVPRLLGEEYNGTLPILIALSPLVLLRTLSLFPLNALLGLRRYVLRFFVIFSSTVVNVILNFALIPTYGWQGAVGSTIVTELCLILVVWLCVARAQRRHDEAYDASLRRVPPTIAPSP